PRPEFIADQAFPRQTDLASMGSDLRQVPRIGLTWYPQGATEPDENGAQPLHGRAEQGGTPMPTITRTSSGRAATLALALALGVAMTTSALASPVRPATVAVATVEPDYDATDTWTYEPNTVTIHPGH